MIWRQLHRSLLRAFSCLVYLATATGPHHLTNCNKGHYLFHTLLSVIVISICAAQQCLPHVSSAFIAAQLVPFQPLEWVPVGNLCDFPAADCDEVIAVWTRRWQLTENWCSAKQYSVSWLWAGASWSPENVNKKTHIIFTGQNVHQCCVIN